MDGAGRAASVSARGWGWRHGSRLAWALRDLDLEIAAGERVLLLGASGAGKSTLLHAIAGVLGGDDEGEQSGALRVDGMPPARARGRSGLILQNPDAQVVLARVGDDVAFGCENLGIPREEIWARVDAALGSVGLDLPRAHPTSALSGGQKQRLALAGLLAMRPGMLLLDEPTANLDPAGVREVRDAVGRVLDETGATFVVVEHRVEVWLPLVDRVVVLAPDGVVADGDPATVLRARGAELAQQGVWVPGHGPRHPAPPAPPGPVLLRADALAAGRVRDRAAVSGVSTAVRAGATLAITGPNGAGKSTLGLTLAGLLRPLAGEVVAQRALAGEAGTAPIAWSSRTLLTRIGTVLQDPEHQLLGRTVRDELEIGPRALGLAQPEIDARVDDLLQRMRLAALARANPYTLSGGEKRRLTVAAALATRPRVLVLDEPTFGQDARTWEELVGLIARLRDGVEAPPVGVVVITHDEDVVAALHADRLALGAGA